MAMLVTPHWRSQSRTANTHGSGQIPAGKIVWEDVKKKIVGQCPVKVVGETLSHIIDIKLILYLSLKDFLRQNGLLMDNVL